MSAAHSPGQREADFIHLAKEWRENADSKGGAHNLLRSASKPVSCLERVLKMPGYRHSKPKSRLAAR
jgi:hypothetical protein